MFIVNHPNHNTVCKITRKSATKSLEKDIEEGLKPFYKESFLEEVVSEIMQHITFPRIMDSNSVFVYDNDKFQEYVFGPEGITNTGKEYVLQDFAPAYTGGKVRQIEKLLKYSIYGLLHNHDEYINAMIVQAGNDYNVISMSKDIKATIMNALSEILDESSSTKIASSIVNEIFSSSMVFAGLGQENDVVYYSLEESGTCKKVKAFSVSELHKAIMKQLPNLESISKSANKIAVLIHNQILYGVNEREYKMVPYGNDEEGKLIFKKTVNGIDLFYSSYWGGFWYSDIIQASTSDIEWKKDKENPDEEIGYYHGLHIAGKHGMSMIDWKDTDEKKLNGRIPIIRKSGRIRYGAIYRYYIVPRASGFKGEHITEEPFQVYFRVIEV